VASPSHAEAVAAVDWLHAHGQECAIVPQVLYEYQYFQVRVIVADAASVGVSHCGSLLTDAGSVRHEFGSTE